MSQVQIPHLDQCIWQARINHLCKSGLILSTASLVFILIHKLLCCLNASFVYNFMFMLRNTFVILILKMRYRLCLTVSSFQFLWEDVIQGHWVGLARSRAGCSTTLNLNNFGQTFMILTFLAHTVGQIVSLPSNYCKNMELWPEGCKMENFCGPSLSQWSDSSRERKNFSHFDYFWLEVWNYLLDMTNVGKPLCFCDSYKFNYVCDVVLLHCYIVSI